MNNIANYTPISSDDWKKLKDKTGNYIVEFYNKYDLIKAYFKDSLYHNETGPARILNTGEKQYWFNGKKYGKASFDTELTIDLPGLFTNKSWTKFCSTIKT